MATPQILPITHKMKPGFAELQARGYLVSAEAIKVGKFTRVKFARRATHPSEQDSDQTLPEAHSDAAQDLVEMTPLTPRKRPWQPSTSATAHRKN